jgi:hypothetical protein
VFHVHARLERPQLIANSRHITGAAGILKQSWTSSMTLQGTSDTVPHAPYTLFFYVPEGFEFEKALAQGVAVDCVPGSDGLLKVSFPGQKAPVDWSVRFAKK